MAKLTDFKTPTGQSGNILSVSSWSQMILGSAVLFMTVAIGQNLVGKVGSRTPFLDTQIDKPWNDPQPTAPKNSVEVL